MVIIKLNDKYHKSYGGRVKYEILNKQVTFISNNKLPLQIGSLFITHSFRLCSEDDSSVN